MNKQFTEDELEAINIARELVINSIIDAVRGRTVNEAKELMFEARDRLSNIVIVPKL